MSHIEALRDAASRHLAELRAPPDVSEARRERLDFAERLIHRALNAIAREIADLTEPNIEA